MRREFTIVAEWPDSEAFDILTGHIRQHLMGPSYVSPDVKLSVGSHDCQDGLQVGDSVTVSGCGHREYTVREALTVSA